MPLPMIPLAVGAAALGGYYWFVVRPKGAVAGPGAASPSGGGAQPAAPGSAAKVSSATGTAASLPTGFPAELSGKFQQLMAQGQDSDAMDQVADKCEQLGYATQALQLRLRAAELRARMAPPVPPPPAYVPQVQPTPEQAYVPPPTVTTMTARVTTNDPAPGGDLIIRNAPSGTAQQIGGAAKGSVVTIVDPMPSDPTWAKVSAQVAAMNWPAAQGYARKAYLVNTATGAVIAGRAGHRQADLIGGIGRRLGVRHNRIY